MYGVILAKHPTSIAELVRVLTSVTYALDWLLATSGRCPGHPLSAVPLEKIKFYLFARKTTSQSSRAIDCLRLQASPHVAQLNLMTSLLELCQTTLLKVNELADIVRQSFLGYGVKS